MSHANEFWNFENADRSEDNPKGYFTPLFPHNLGRPLHHPEQDYNAHLIGQIIKGYRVVGSGPDGEMTQADLELGIKLHEVNPGDGSPGSADADYAHYIEAGAKDYEWIWVPAEMGGTATSPLAVSGVVTDKNECTGQFAQITAQATGGSPMYEFSLQTSNVINFGNIQDWSTSNSFVVYNGSPLVPGQTYYIYIKDAANTNVISSALTPDEIDSHTSELTVTQNVSQPGGDDAQLEATVTGGIGPFNYALYQGVSVNPATSTLIEEINGTNSTSITFPINASGNTPIGIGSGSYFVLIDDATTGCSINSQLVSVTQPQPLTSTYIKGNSLCYQGTHTFTFNGGTGGTAPYEYSITDPNTGGYTWTTDLIYSGIAPGATSIYPAVKDSSGFIVDLGIITFEDPLDYSFGVSSQDAGCSGFGGSITFNALQGGPGPNVWSDPEEWQFSIDNGQTWSATWQEINPGDSYTYSVPTAGSYQCKVRRANSLTGEVACESPFQEITVGAADTITLATGRVNDAICGTNGSGEIVITNILIGGQNASLDYSVEWTNLANPAMSGSDTAQTSNSYNITGLDAGTYDVVVTNTAVSGGCSYTFNIEILEVASNIEINANAYDAICNSGTGYIDWSIVGGVAPFNIEIEAEGTGVWNMVENATSLISGSTYGIPTGTHNIRVTDGNSCQDVTQITIGEPSEVVASINIDNNNICYGSSGGQLTANGTGGDGNYNYLWSNGETTPSIDNLAAGVYSVTITDGNGCESDPVSAQILEYAQINITLENKTDVSCNGGNNGSAEITVTGDGPFTYEWRDLSDVTTVVSTDQNPTDLSAGTYVVKVTGAGGCTAASPWSAIIAEPTAISHSTSTTDETIDGQNDGSATISVGGGVPDYAIYLNGAQVSGTPGQTEFIFNNLEPGNYTYTVEDANGCQEPGTFTIAPGTGGISITDLTADAPLCHGGTTDIIMTVSGGSGDYQYAVNPISGSSTTPTYGQTTQATTNTWNSQAGSWILWVKDATTGTEISQSISISQPAIMSFVFSGAETYPGANDASVSVSINGGTAPYSITCNETSETIQVSQENTPAGPFTTINSAGTYTFSVTDSNNCPDNATTTISTTYSNISIDSVTPTEVCYGATDGMIFITGSGGSGNYSYSVDGGTTYTTSNSINGLAGGDYNVWLKDDSTGETLEWSSNPVTINEALEIQVLESRISNPTCSENAEFYIKFSGSNLTNDVAGNQSVLLTWTQGNQGAINYSENITNIVSLGNNQFEGSIEISNSAVYIAGTFNFTITSDGCESSHGPVSYIEADPVTMSATAISEPECPTDEWVFELSAIGGVSGSYNAYINGGGNIVSNWDGSSTQFTIPQGASNQTIIVEDVDYANNGCSDSRNINTPSTTAIVVSGSVNNPDCASTGGSTASFSITGGQPSGNTYKYKVSTDNGANYGSEQSYTGPVNGLSVANGTIVIKAYRYSNGNSTESTCAVEQLLGTVINPVAISGQVTGSSSPTGCIAPNNSNGFIVMTVSGGTGVYEFSKDGGSNFVTLTPSGGQYLFDNLTAGSYGIVVRDSNGCQAFTDTITLSAPASPTVSSHNFQGCWRDSDTAQVELNIILADVTGQQNGDYSFYNAAADVQTVYDGKFTYSNSDTTTHQQTPVTITEIATGCQYVMNSFNFQPVPAIQSTAAITNINNSPTAGDVNDFSISNVSGGLGAPYWVDLIDSSGNTYGSITHTGGTSYIYDVPAGDYTYKISDYSGGTTGCGRTYTTPMTATVTQTNEETFYHIHTGSGSVYPFADLMSSNGAYLIGDSTYTVYNLGVQSDFDTVMTNLIDLGDGTNSSPNVGSFDFAGPITGNNCGQTWTHNASAGSNYYYLAVPNNSLFTENLVTDGVFQYQCNGLTSYATTRKAFTYNGESYWLYKLAPGTGTAANQYGFK